MAKKETSAKRKAAGRKAWKKRVAKARAAGHKSIKVGKRRVSIVGGPQSAKGARKGKAKSYRTAAKVERKAARKSKSKGHRKSKSKSRARKGHARKVAPIQTVRTRIIKVPGKTRRVIVTAAAEKRGRRHHRRHHRGHLMENPLTGVELFAGGLTMLLGLGVADMSDRYWATHALTGTGSFTDTPSTTQTNLFGATTYPGMKNGAAVLAPMNLTRWISGGLLVAVPFIAAPFVKAPVARSALQMFGFGAFARIGGKALVDLFSGLLGSTAIGQQLYVNELAAAAQNQASQGSAVTIQLPNSVTATAAGSGVATGLARPMPGGCGCCGSCSKGQPCTGRASAAAAAASAPPAYSPPAASAPPSGPPAYSPPAAPPGSYSTPTTPSSPGAPSLPALPPPIVSHVPGTPGMSHTVVQPYAQPGVPGTSIIGNINRASTSQVSGGPSQATLAGRPRPNPYGWWLQ
jgi:hypothetical protein